MPWNKALSDDERTQLLALLRKMLDVDAGDPAAANAAEDAMRGPLASMLVNALQDHTPQSDPTGSPAVDGGGESVVSEPSVAS
jgi:hypothetical protein